MEAVSIEDCLSQARDLGKSLDAERLLEHVLKMSRTHVFAHPERVLSEEEWARYRVLWQRVDAGEPLAYVTGVAAFFGMEFHVDERVLIPRPETELLVEAVLDRVSGLNAPRIWDVGTGSGAIALALAKTLSEAEILATDVSAEALQVASANARRLGLERVRFAVADLLEGVNFSANVMVANLPYIGTKQFHFVEKSVEDYEPPVALFGGEDGLRLYARLFEQVSCLGAARPSCVIGEFGAFQREALQILIESGFPMFPVTFHTDLAGLDRFFILDCRYVG